MNKSKQKLEDRLAELTEATSGPERRIKLSPQMQQYLQACLDSLLEKRRQNQTINAEDITLPEDIPELDLTSLQKVDTWDYLGPRKKP